MHQIETIAIDILDEKNFRIALIEVQCKAQTTYSYIQYFTSTILVPLKINII